MSNLVQIGRPHPESYLAFHLKAREIMEAEPTPPFWLPPVDLSTLADLEVLAYWRRKNPLLEGTEKYLRKAAVDELLAAGVPHELLSEPLSGNMAEFIADRVRERRCVFQLIDRDIEQRTRDRLRQLPRIKPEWRVVMGAWMALPGKDRPFSHHSKVADLLSRGVPRTKNWELARDHIDRAKKQFVDTLLERLSYAQKELRDAIRQAELREIANIFNALDLVYEQSRQRAEFRHLTGEALALAIHHNHYRSLPEVIDKALDFIAAA
jgi:hypothetical protein